MDIAAASVAMSLNNVQSQASLSIFCKAKDMQEQSASDMLNSMLPKQTPKLAPGAVGFHMDILA
jgi:hypothetical protein